MCRNAQCTGAGAGIQIASYTLSMFDGLSSYQWTGSSWPNSPSASMWVRAVSTTSTPFQVSITSGIEWRNSKQYTLNYFIKDNAENQTNFSAITFVYDSSAPAISNINISSGSTFSDSNDLPGAISGVRSRRRWAKSETRWRMSSSRICFR